MNPEKIKAWLEKIGKDRAWLATQTGASKHTVDGWLAPNSSRAIPATAQATITRLMHESMTSPASRVMATFTTDEFELIEAARHEVGDPPRPQFYHDAIMEYTEAILNKESGKKVTYGQFTQDIHPEARVAEE